MKWRKRLVNKKRKPCQLMVQSDPSSLKLRRTGSSWLQEDPPSLKLRRGRQLMAVNDPASLYRAMPDKSLQQAVHGPDRPAAKSYAEDQMLSG